MSIQEPTHAGGRIIALIVAALVLWGLYHALGAATQFSDAGANPWRGVAVGGCFLAFIGFWLLMLRIRSARVGKNRRDSQ